MPDFNETAVNQPFPRSSPRPRDRSHERYPHDSLEQVYVRRRRSPRDGHSLSPPPEKGLPRSAVRSHRSDSSGSSPRNAHSFSPSPEKGLPRLAVRSYRSDSSGGSPRSHLSDSSSSSPRHVRFDDEGRYDSSDSEDEYRERRINRRHKADRRDLNIIPYPDDLALKPFGAGLRRDDRYDYNSDSDSDSDSSTGSSLSADEAYKQERRMRNKKQLNVGLACITTIAAGNNIIQSMAAHHARRKLIEEGEMSMGESRKLRRRALMLDLIGVGVAAVGINNARNGWKKVESVGKS